MTIECYHINPDDYSPEPSRGTYTQLYEPTDDWTSCQRGLLSMFNAPHHFLVLYPQYLVGFMLACPMYSFEYNFVEAITDMSREVSRDHQIIIPDWECIPQCNPYNEI